ncbi:hypothetical protein [Ensifer sp. 4252]|uniref:hypothetical protein n=1 Tax=Ensifer sp. 4252 TaxID=3373915 RepID=UPI003D1A3FB7
MVGIPKTLEDMSVRERCCMLETVAGALEAVAEEAEDLGDARFAANSKCVAGTIRGYADNFGAHDLKSAELILEMGITLVHLSSTRSGGAAAAMTDNPEACH